MQKSLFQAKFPGFATIRKRPIFWWLFYFFLEKKVTKIQGCITMLAFLSWRYLRAIQGMEEHNKSWHFALLCIATHMPCAHTST